MKTKNKILPEQEEEKTFQYRTYGKGELALLYLPNILQQSAVDRFNEWIEAAPGLKERLLATGMNPRSRDGLSPCDRDKPLQRTSLPISGTTIYHTEEIDSCY